MTEDQVTFENQGQRLYGILHRPEGNTRPRVGVVMLHGWGSYRIGPHQMFTKAARTLCRAGYACLRFDFRGRGDSEGEAAEANLATMISDTEVAVDNLVQWLDVKRVALLGMCSGGEVAIGAGVLREVIDSLLLWSVPMVALEEGRQRPESRTWHNLKEYARKLLRPETWRKILTGSVRTDMVRKALFEGGAYETPEENVKLGIDWYDRFTRFRGAMLFVYGGNDPSAEPSIAHYRSLCEEADIPAEFQVVSGSNHAFYSLAWEQEVIAGTLAWLNRRYSQPGDAHGADAA